jgi:uncharacterized membrane protein
LSIGMPFDVAILLAALGITTLEFSEAAAVGLALYAESRSHMAFFYVAMGSLVVLIPTVFAGAAIGHLPRQYVLLVGGVLLAYFGQRLVKSARRSVYFERKGSVKVETFEKGLAVTGFSVGAIEAFEAAIVLVGLLPQSFNSTLVGLGIGVVVVIVAAYLLRSHVRKVKQANMKVAVAAILLSFAVFWFGELVWLEFSLGQLSDLLLIPIFVVWFVLIYKISHRQFPELVLQQSSKEQKQSE